MGQLVDIDRICFAVTSGYLQIAVKICFINKNRLRQQCLESKCFKVSMQKYNYNYTVTIQL